MIAGFFIGGKVCISHERRKARLGTLDRGWSEHHCESCILSELRLRRFACSGACGPSEERCCPIVRIRRY